MNIRILDKNPKGALAYGGKKVDYETDSIEIWRAKYSSGEIASDEYVEQWIVGDLNHEILHLVIHKVTNVYISNSFDNLFRDGRGWNMKRIKLLRSWGLA